MTTGKKEPAKRARPKSQLAEQEIFTSKDNLKFDLWADQWNLAANILIKLNWMHEVMPINQEEAFRRALAHQASSFSAETLRNTLSCFKSALIKHIDEQKKGVTIHVLLEILLEDQYSPQKLSMSINPLKKVREHGFIAVFENGMADFLDNIRISRCSAFNPEKSELTRAMTDYEREQFIYQLARARFANRLSTFAYLQLLLLLCAGKRTKQIEDTKISDFTYEVTTIGKKTRKVLKWRCPVAKQRGAKFRSEFNDCYLTSEIDFKTEIDRASRQSIASVENYLGITLTEEQRLQVPLFSCLKNISQVRKNYINNKHLDELLDGNAFHSSHIHSNLSPLLTNTSIFAVQSEQTGELLSLYPRRFRHTRATLLALSGANISELVNALDHSTSKTAAVYVSNLPKRAVQIGKKVEATLGALAKRFDRTQAFIPDAEKIIKHYTKHKAEDIGNCGRETFCEEDYPRACYLCELFIPNPLGNHKAVFESVQKDLERAIEYGGEQMIENYQVLQIAILEHMFLANQVLREILHEVPAIPINVSALEAPLHEVQS